MKQEHKVWLRKVSRLHPEERVAFWINLKGLKKSFSGFRTNTMHAQNVKGDMFLTDREKSTLIGAIEVANAIDAALEQKKISGRHGVLLNQALHWWIEKAAKQRRMN